MDRDAARRRTLPERRGEETRKRILEAAARIFARRGFAGASMDDIAADAGASKGALYHHFATKRALFDALLEHRSTQRSELHELAIQAVSLEQLLSQLVDRFFAHATSNPDAIVLSLESRLQATRDPGAREVLSTYYEQIRQDLDDVLHTASQRFDLPAPSPDLATIAFALLDGAGQQAAIGVGSRNLDDVKGALVRALSNLVLKQ